MGRTGLREDEIVMVREGLRAARGSVSVAVLVGLSILALVGLFVTSWLIFMPVVALLLTPITLAVSLPFGLPPSPVLNAVGAVLLSLGMAGASVAAALRVLLRRARERERQAADARAVPG